MTPVLDGVHSVHAPFYNGSSSDAEAQTGTTSLWLSGAIDPGGLHHENSAIYCIDFKPTKWVLHGMYNCKWRGL